MKFIIRGKNIEVTDALKQYTEEKIGKIEKYFDDLPIEARISLEVEKERHIVEVTVYIDGLIIRGEEVTGDMYASIDGVIEKLERQIHKYKTRINRKIKEERRELKADLAEVNLLDEDEEDDEPEIVRTKRFAMKPMNVEEAVMQMELLDHDFFVFLNSASEEVNVVYKRNAGDYGLIEPTLG
ncbi:ribosome hibernation-promoting factor, HPF/YfiA family [Sporohalobacter salinus]|uniref:ribosome hibernation-promoting factor, HPF/YfiA family n=1 Tax=Sporohalobacter salinus TaxID=1494606 RepID=UPI00195F4198|nr:ribosome-associated translation inhibitor RaiA [Sporohalobacter salinus]MBM7624153.1 putative sigma-54 modulation protein [Sporohalobacter salinus]